MKHKENWWDKRAKEIKDRKDSGIKPYEVVAIHPAGTGYRMWDTGWMKEYMGTWHYGQIPPEWAGLVAIEEHKTGCDAGDHKYERSEATLRYICSECKKMKEED